MLDIFTQRRRKGQEKSDLYICLGIDKREVQYFLASLLLQVRGNVRITFCSLLKEGKGRNDLCGSFKGAKVCQEGDLR